jgi:hypothetical protein
MSAKFVYCTRLKTRTIHHNLHSQSIAIATKNFKSWNREVRQYCNVVRSHNDIRQQPRHQKLNSAANRTTVNHYWTAIAPTARIKTWQQKSGKPALKTAAQEKFNTTCKQKKQLQPAENSETGRQTTYLLKRINFFQQKLSAKWIWNQEPHEQNRRSRETSGAGASVLVSCTTKKRLGDGALMR